MTSRRLWSLPGGFVTAASAATCARGASRRRAERMRALEESLERLRAMPDENGQFGEFLDQLEGRGKG